MNKKKVIYDIVHGYIEIDNDTEKVINEPIFQRLRYIKQQASNHLFPSANHTRFEHSLGVMCLAEKAFRQFASELDYTINKVKFFKRNLNRLLINEQKPTTYLDFDIDKKTHRKIYEHWLKFHLKFAALLHDVGHSPLSHIGEYFYEKEDIINKIQNIINCHNIKEYHKINDEKNINLNDFLKGSKHEWMSCYVILLLFKDILNEIYERIKIEDAKEYKLNTQMPLNVDFGFIIRIITGNDYNVCDIRNGIIKLVNSETIDVDRIDYALRDNLMVGNLGAIIDTERLLSSISFNKTNYKITFKKGAISALKNFVDCRDNLYLWVCNHHLVVYTDFLYRESLKQLFKIRPELRKDLFSCDGIINKLPTDNEIIYYLRDSYNKLTEEKVTDNENNYFLNLLKQLFERNNKLSSLYKTRKDYFDFLKQVDGMIPEEVNSKLNDVIDSKEVFKQFFQKIQKSVTNEFKKGDFLILKKANKDFQEKSIRSILIDDGTKNSNLENYISHRELKDNQDVTIFIYYKPIGNTSDKNKMKDQIKKAINDFVNGIETQ